MAAAETPEQRSYIMSRVRSTGNASTEIRLITLMKKSGIKGWRRKVALIGKPDFVFKKERVAVFVDGCFWHGCSECYRKPTKNSVYWRGKVERNMRRDADVTEQLEAKGWKVLRIWEHELRSKGGGVSECLTRLSELLHREQ